MKSLKYGSSVSDARWPLIRGGAVEAGAGSLVGKWAASQVQEEGSKYSSKACFAAKLTLKGKLKCQAYYNSEAKMASNI